MTSRSRFALAAGTFLLAAVAPHLSYAQGCAMCSTVGNGANDPLVQGMFRSIVFMVSMPFALVATVGGWLVFHLRRETPAVVDSGLVADARLNEFRRS